MTTKRKGKKPETVKVGNVAVRIYRRQKTVKVKLKDGRTVPKIYTVYAVEDYTNGTRRFHDTTKHAKAVAIAQRLADQLANGQTVAARMSNTQAASFGRAVELLKPTGVALEVCAGIFAEMFAIMGGAHHVEAARLWKQTRAAVTTHKTVAEVVTELVQHKKARQKSARYVGDLSARLNRFAKDFGGDISNLTTSDLTHWLDGLKVAPRTAKNFQRVIATLFAFAQARGYIAKGTNPAEDMERINSNGGDIEIYTPKELADLLKHAPKDYLPYVALGAFAGLRSAEIERLEWKDIDLPGGYIHVAADKAKTAQRRLVPVLPNLARWLKPYAKRRGKVWTGNIYDLQEARAETTKAAAVAWKSNGLRHSFVSYRLADIQNAAQVALEAGNSPTMVFKHYRELVKPAAAKAYFAISPKTPANVLTMPEQKEAAQ